MNIEMLCTENLKNTTESQEYVVHLEMRVLI